MRKILLADTLLLSATAILYYLLARFGMSLFSLEPGNITLLWLPSGLALIMAIEWGFISVPFIILASFLANYPGMALSSGKYPLLFTSINSIADGFTGILAMQLLKKFLPNGLQYTNDLFPFGLVWFITTSITSSFISVSMVIGEYIPLERVFSFIRMLVLADSLGIILIYPIYTSWKSDRLFIKKDILFSMLAIAIIAALLILGFTVLPGMIYFIVPIIIILSFNVKSLNVMIITSLTLVLIIAATAKNLGPFIFQDPEDSNFRLMAFVFSSSLAILGVVLQSHQLGISESSSKLWQDAAEHDPLTGLINRRAFIPILNKEHQRANQTGKIYTLALLDLDHFKIINDSYGHQSGDRVLCSIAKIMNENCRSSDSIVRMGGEEFAILFPNCTMEEAFLPLERIRANLASQPLQVDNALIFVTISIGVASFMREENDFELMLRADKALYTAKSAGRNKIILDKRASI